MDDCVFISLDDDRRKHSNVCEIDKRELGHYSISSDTILLNVTLVAQMLFDQIKNSLVKTAGTDPKLFENPELKVSDLQLDSLGLVEMLFEIEDKYGFQIPDPMIFLPMTFAEMVSAIGAMVEAQAQAQSKSTNS